MEKKVKDKEINKKADFIIDLNEIPNGNKKPIELCKFLEKMKLWREEFIFD